MGQDGMGRPRPLPRLANTDASAAFPILVRWLSGSFPSPPQEQEAAHEMVLSRFQAVHDLLPPRLSVHLVQEWHHETSAGMAEWRQQIQARSERRRFRF